MFLRFLSNYDYEDEFSYFIFRMETLLAAFVVEASKHIDHLTDEQAKNYFENCFAQCFDQNNETLNNFWTPPFPSIEWFWNYFDRELPFMIREAKRLAQEKQIPQTPDFDKKKVREYARLNPTFLAQLFPNQSDLLINDNLDNNHSH